MIPSKYDLTPILDEARARLAELADEYRQEVLLPFCREHKLTFISGMGRTVFYTKDECSFGDADEALDEGYPEARPIFAVLNQDALGRNDCFGYYVADVRTADLKAKRKASK